MADRAADLALVLLLGDLADELTLGSWRSGALSTRAKSDGSPVTSVDVEVERTLRNRVLQMHPEDGFVSEELGTTSGTSGRCWYVDGVDGTRAYIDGRPEWSTLIALTDGGDLRQALCTGPALGKRWYVGTNGASVKRASPGHTGPVRVAARALGSNARIACWPPAARLAGQVPDQTRTRLHELTAGRSTRPSWGAGVPNAAMLVAEGALDAFVLVGGGPWDHAAAAAIVVGAGGAWSSLSGQGDLHASAIVLTNGSIHEWLLDQLRPQGDPSRG